ncbi:methylated-DNA--[protein]-cysteine S-methyltransferase [Halomonas sp. GXIMD04776]|uniref:methylated-DNA--[protein]-cysteine S-methyltransferase n=1 Tax=Halomonas sp. GXIMD04776 TaxID=3415605 RepID=UPI003CA2014F
MYYTIFSSPLGELLLAGDEMGLHHLCFLEGEQPSLKTDEWQRDDDAFASSRDELLAYLEGRRRHFDADIAPGGSESQRETWSAVMRIPYGQTRTYGDLAHRLGNDKAAIAISSATAANPLPILIPCHRVVAADGIGSYVGGEAIKRQLLDLERQHRPE